PRQGIPEPGPRHPAYTLSAPRRRRPRPVTRKASMPQNSSPRIVFAGTPDAAVPSLTALLAGGADVVGVVTRPDAPRGRKRVLTPSPVAAAAEEEGLPVIRAHRLDEEVTGRIERLEPDLGVI